MLKAKTYHNKYMQFYHQTRLSTFNTSRNNEPLLCKEFPLGGFALVIAGISSSRDPIT